CAREGLTSWFVYW
nr:immunoglobulin heavy chain junction region [Mus musculus]MBK4187089.1 immunoglobulin heavy chain junction region [Mus musculus]